MTTTATRSQDAGTDARVGKVDMKLEVVTIPVSDVDRAKEFYGRLGWRLDADFTSPRLPRGPVHAAWLPVLDSLRHEPHRRRARIRPGPVLIVSDIQAARDELIAARRRGRARCSTSPAGTGSSPTDGWRPRSGPAVATARSRRSAIRTATAGCCRRSRRGCPAGSTLLRLRSAPQRPGERVSACGGRPRRAREAHRPARCELARLVRRVHGGGAGRDGAADVSVDARTGRQSRCAHHGTWPRGGRERAELPGRPSS